MKSTSGSSVTFLRLASCACVIAMLGGCFDGAAPAPKEFEAAAPSGAKPDATNTCPDLTGTFDLAGTTLAKDIAGRQPPDTKGLPVLLTFKPGPTNIEGWWVVPRERLVAFAKDLAKDSPKRYATWRWLMIEKNLPEPMRHDFDKYLAAVAEIGPPGPTYAMIVGRRCERNWMLVYDEHEQAAGKDGTPRQVEREIWLARDAAGTLLVRRTTYGLKSYSLWAASTQYLRTSRASTFERIAQAPAESAEKLTDAELPPDPATVQPPKMLCADVPAHAEAFSQRLKALIPPKSQVTRFALNPVRQQDGDGHCPFAVVDVEIVGGNDHFLSRTVDWLRAEPNVDSVENLRLDAGQRSNNMRRLRVVLR